jgi:hypothetical protein
MQSPPEPGERIPEEVRKDAFDKLGEADFAEVRDYHRDQLNVNVAKINLSTTYENGNSDWSELGWLQDGPDDVPVHELVATYSPHERSSVYYLYSGAVVIGMATDEEDLEAGFETIEEEVIRQHDESDILMNWWEFDV